jgi:hypothetical protein
MFILSRNEIWNFPWKVSTNDVINAKAFALSFILIHLCNKLLSYSQHFFFFMTCKGLSKLDCLFLADLSSLL